MNRLVLVLVMLASLHRLASAQELPKFDAPMPTSTQVLKMRYDGLVKWADKHSKNPNEMQQDNLAAWYEKIRLRASQPQLNARPTLAAAMNAVGKWNAAYYSALLAYNRGGTLYAHQANRSGAELADVEADALAAWRSRPSKTIVLATIKPFATNYKTIPDYIDDKAEYKRVLKEESRALDRAREAVGVLPAGPRNLLAKYMFDLSTTNWGEEK